MSVNMPRHAHSYPRSHPPALHTSLYSGLRPCLCTRLYTRLYTRRYAHLCTRPRTCLPEGCGAHARHCAASLRPSDAGGAAARSLPWLLCSDCRSACAGTAESVCSHPCTVNAEPLCGHCAAPLQRLCSQGTVCLRSPCAVTVPSLFRPCAQTATVTVTVLGSPVCRYTHHVPARSLRSQCRAPVWSLCNPFAMTVRPRYSPSSAVLVLFCPCA